MNKTNKKIRVWANLLICIDFREKLSSFFAERRLDVGWDEGEWLRSFSIFLSVWQMSFSRNINDFREKTTKKRGESLLLPSYRITNIDVMKVMVMSWAEENQAKQCLCFKQILDKPYNIKLFAAVCSFFPCSLLSTRVDNKKVGVDIGKALELDNRIYFSYFSLISI